jgi:hypothetical protein
MQHVAALVRVPMRGFRGTALPCRGADRHRVVCVQCMTLLLGLGTARADRRARAHIVQSPSSRRGARAGNYWAIECGRTRVESAQRTSFRPFSMPGPRLIADVSWPSTTPILVCAYVVRTVCVPSRGRSGMEPYTPRSCYSIMAQSFLTYTQASLRWYVTHCTA